MKVVILAGGRGTRLSEETVVKPKPLVEIGNMPILWHIMKIYSTYGFNEFIICSGYKAHMIKEFFKNYLIYKSDVVFDLKSERVDVYENKCEPWKVHVIDTGLNTETGGRIKRIEKYVKGETFMLTYGDGVADINIKKLVEFHKSHGRLATVTAVQPPGRFGHLKFLDVGSNFVAAFQEKPKGDGAFINGGFFVLEPEIFKYIKDDSTKWEEEPLETLAKESQLVAYKHIGFWKPMDTLRDKE